MNEIRLIAEFDANPSDSEKATIREEMNAFLQNIAPGIVLREVTGEGSWWIELVGMATPAVQYVGAIAPEAAKWLILAAGSWYVSRKLTKWADGKSPAAPPPKETPLSSGPPVVQEEHSDAVKWEEAHAHVVGCLTELKNKIERSSGPAAFKIARIRYGERRVPQDQALVVSLDFTKLGPANLDIVRCHSQQDFIDLFRSGV